ncbi:MAG: hypothetical protein ACP5OC_02670 [Thermoplasmata archaeon]
MSYKDCFAEMKDDEDEVAECIHCLRKHGQIVYFRDDLKRLALGREEYDQSDADEMAKMSSILGISDRKSYEEMDRKFNLTMY